MWHFNVRFLWIKLTIFQFKWTIYNCVELTYLVSSWSLVFFNMKNVHCTVIHSGNLFALYDRKIHFIFVLDLFTKLKKVFIEMHLRVQSFYQILYTFAWIRSTENNEKKLIRILNMAIILLYVPLNVHSESNHPIKSVWKIPCNISVLGTWCFLCTASCHFSDIMARCEPTTFQLHFHWIMNAMQFTAVEWNMAFCDKSPWNMSFYKSSYCEIDVNSSVSPTEERKITVFPCWNKANSKLQVLIFSSCFICIRSSQRHFSSSFFSSSFFFFCILMKWA